MAFNQTKSPAEQQAIFRKEIRHASCSDLYQFLKEAPLSVAAPAGLDNYTSSETLVHVKLDERNLKAMLGAMLVKQNRLEKAVELLMEDKRRQQEQIKQLNAALRYTEDMDPGDMPVDFYSRNFDSSSS